MSDTNEILNDIEIPPKAKTALGKIRVLIVDDHAIFRESLRAIFNLYDDIDVIGEASDGRQAIDRVQELNPDVIIMDLKMPGIDGIESTRRIIKRNPKAKVLMLTQCHDREHIILSIRAGVLGYVLKQASISDLIPAIHALYYGESYLCHSAVSALRQEYLLCSREEPYDRLTGREREIFKLIAEGYSSRQIADQLSISLKSVLGHRDKIMKKLDIHNRAELIKYAIRKGLVEL